MLQGLHASSDTNRPNDRLKLPHGGELDLHNRILHLGSDSSTKGSTAQVEAAPLTQALDGRGC
jgi:hypothetical protein